MTEALQTDDIIIISAHTVLEKEISVKVDVEFQPGRDQKEKDSSIKYLTAFSDIE